MKAISLQRVLNPRWQTLLGMSIPVHNIGTFITLPKKCSHVKLQLKLFFTLCICDDFVLVIQSDNEVIA